MSSLLYVNYVQLLYNHVLYTVNSCKHSINTICSDATVSCSNTSHILHTFFLWTAQNDQHMSWCRAPKASTVDSISFMVNFWTSLPFKGTDQQPWNTASWRTYRCLLFFWGESHVGKTCWDWVGHLWNFLGLKSTLTFQMFSAYLAISICPTAEEAGDIQRRS